MAPRYRPDDAPPVEYLEDMNLQLSLLKNDWAERVEPMICAAIPSGDYFTSDELHDLYGIPKPDHVNWWGVLLAGMKRKGLIEHCNYQKSKRPEANSRPVVLWRMK